MANSSHAEQIYQDAYEEEGGGDDQNCFIISLIKLNLRQ